MKTALRWFLIVGFILTAVFTALAQRGVASAAAGSLTMTIHTYNYAKVDHKILKAAEEVATGIFRKAGVESRWVDTVVTSETKQAKPAGEAAFNLSHIQLSFLSRSMADRLGLPNNVMGLAPGTGPDRQRVYLFVDNVRALAHRHMTARANGTNRACVNTSEILGHSVAHEIGHLLLNVRSHSATGIMRGDWDLNALKDACYGYLLFTPQEAEAIRIEVGRRTQTTANGILSNQEKNGPETSASSYSVQGATPERESALRNLIGIMQPAVFPQRVVLVPHWRYVDATKMFRLNVPGGMTSRMFTHLASRPMFVDVDRYVNGDWLGYRWHMNWGI